MNDKELTEQRKRIKYNSDINKLYTESKNSQKLRAIVNEIKTNLIYEENNKKQFMQKINGLDLKNEQLDLLERYDIIKKKMLNFYLKNLKMC